MFAGQHSKGIWKTRVRNPYKGYINPYVIGLMSLYPICGKTMGVDRPPKEWLSFLCGGNSGNRWELIDSPYKFWFLTTEGSNLWFLWGGIPGLLGLYINNPTYRILITLLIDLTVVISPVGNDCWLIPHIKIWILQCFRLESVDSARRYTWFSGVIINNPTSRGPITSFW